MIINLFSTSNVTSGRSDNLKRMLESVSAARRALPDVEIRLMLLMQNCKGDAGALLSEEERSFTTALAAPGLVPLSKARNILLGEAGRLGWLAGEGIVAYPDDDCWYPESVLEHIHAAFTRQETLDFWFADYASSPVAIRPDLERPAKLSEVLRRASSNTIVFRNRVVREIGLFDEELGVGARYNGSEDTDYALKAFAKARETLFLPQACIGHRDRMPSIRAKYFPAGLLVIARHSSTNRQLLRHLARKMLVGGALVARRELKPSAYITALKTAAAEFTTRRS